MGAYRGFGGGFETLERVYNPSLSPVESRKRGLGGTLPRVYIAVYLCNMRLGDLISMQCTLANSDIRRASVGVGIINLHITHASKTGILSLCSLLI